MLNDKDLLELCVKVSGGFENGGGAHYSTVAGNFDGQGLSVGILQWNAGQGTLQILLQKIGKSMGWEEAQSYFKSDIQQLSILKSAEAIQFCLDHYIEENSTRVDPVALTAWQDFLDSPDAIQAQIEMATDGVLSHSKNLVAQFCSEYQDRLRPYAFFFDLATQSGGMKNSRGSVLPIGAVSQDDYKPALDLAHEKSQKCAGIWELSLTNDPLADLLLYYAYKRSILSNPAYVWDALSRRGSIACRGGVVHDAVVNFQTLLD